MGGGGRDARAAELCPAAELLGAARAGAKGVVGGRGEGDVVGAAVEPVRAELVFALESGDRALEAAERVAHPDETPVRGGDDGGRSVRGEDLAYRAVPPWACELRGDLFLFLGG